MGWKESYRQASFRGVEFFVDSHDASYGRRQATHEYPERDEPYTEDLGRKAREFTVDGYLVGDDYQLARDQLIAEAERPGTGELVHPYLGSLDVQCLGLKVSESRSANRTCTLSLTFIESGQAQYPSSENDAVKTVTTAANGVTDAAEAGFLDRFATDGFPSFVTDIAAGEVAGLAGVLESLAINPAGAAQDVAEFFERVTALADQALVLVGNPSGLADQVLAIMGSVRDVFGGRAETTLRAIRAAYVLTEVVAGATPNRRQQQANTEALAALVRRTALAEQASAVVVRAEEGVSPREAVGVPDAVIGFQTREEAIAVRDELIDALDVEMEDPDATTAEYQKLNALRAEIVRGVPSPELRLPRVAEVIPRATLPSLVVAYGLYEDAGRGSEVAERNRAKHPGFLTGGEPLQVVTDA